jgi:N-methylhydantoinase B/oxoprolinase/acetone carboxylase alpha subunit
MTDAFETAERGELEPNSKPISTHSTTYEERIEALQAQVAVLEDGLRTIRNYTGVHYGAANTLRLIRVLLGESDEGTSQ